MISAQMKLTGLIALMFAIGCGGGGSTNVDVDGSVNVDGGNLVVDAGGDAASATSDGGAPDGAVTDGGVVDGAVVGDDGSIDGAIVGDGGVVDDGAMVDGTVVGDGGAFVDGTVVMDDGSVPDGTVVDSDGGFGPEGGSPMDSGTLMDASTPVDMAPDAPPVSDSDHDGVTDTAEINLYHTNPNDPMSVPTLTVTASVIGSAPTDVCSSATYGASSGGTPYGAVTYSWDFGDGQTATGSLPSHRISITGERVVTVTARDQGELVATDTVTVTIGAAERDRELRFEIRAGDPDMIDYIRSVRVRAPAIGISDDLMLYDDGIAGGDDTSGDGVFTGTALIESCASTSSTVTIIVQDASGVETMQTRPASAFVVP